VREDDKEVGELKRLNRALLEKVREYKKEVDELKRRNIALPEKVSDDEKKQAELEKKAMEQRLKEVADVLPGLVTAKDELEAEMRVLRQVVLLLDGRFHYREEAAFKKSGRANTLEELRNWRIGLSLRELEALCRGSG
jgi:predicted  nucleic acid-binding Zn-ribbon protein